MEITKEQQEQIDINMSNDSFLAEEALEVHGWLDEAGIPRVKEYTDDEDEWIGIMPLIDRVLMFAGKLND